MTEAEREALVRAWPWPQEAATTGAGFDQVCEAVEEIVRERMAEAWHEGANAGGLMEHQWDPIPNPYRTTTP